jgi:hypothetical protein
MCCVGLVIGELPIILFNLGLDEEGNVGSNKIEEKLMKAFLESKNNLNIFARDVNDIARVIQEGIKEYDEDKETNKEFFDK